LVERFLDALEPADGKTTSRRPLILRGRCYEREAIPFKALDAAMDALVTHLSREDYVEVSHALPADVQALTQLFPALGRLSVVQRLCSPNTRRMAAPHAREEAESALLAGDRQAAHALLETSLRSFEALGLVDEAARDRYAYGALRGDAEGAALQTAALETLRASAT
jgi:hypothetical protein